MADFDLRNPPGDFVARPSGIWDTRASFHYFLAIYKREMRTYAISAMVNDRMDGDLLEARAAGKTLNDFLVTEGGRSAKRYWRDYELSQTKTNLEGVVRGPIYSEARKDLLVAQEALRRGSLISIFSLFEAFIHCWALNYLLARLESGFEWTKEESLIARGLSPVHGVKLPPNVSKITNAITLIRASLQKVDANGRAPDNEKFQDNGFCLFDSLNFWRSLRNNIVHNRGFCTPRLFERYSQYWETCLSEYKRDSFIERERLTVSPELLRKYHVVIYKSALTMEEALRLMSGDRRGHPFAPLPKPLDTSQPPKYSERLLVAGDHSLSLAWHTDSTLREKYKNRHTTENVA
jgi:hypothetical protein